MIKGQLDSTLTQLIHARNRLVIILVGVIACLFILLLILLPLSQKREQIIVLPDVVTEPFTLNAKNVSASYLRQMADYYTRLSHSVTPKSVDAQIETLLNHVPPRFVHELKADFIKHADAIKQKNITSTFYPTTFTFHDDIMTVDVSGDFIVFWGREHVREQKILRVNFLYENARLWVQSIEDIT